MLWLLLLIAALVALLLGLAVAAKWLFIVALIVLVLAAVSGVGSYRGRGGPPVI